ncbi:SCO7613 C-terminal domain-containing membrane protein [Glycomyces buryatensis]|uniref:DUF2157 domain-containing protein n=1 Tax=Glycomyces buryatensis TaxID=2570927 RepID=A0A4S8QDI0_9ACTN|nr:hypothetical protein [Glycomyces buryatensis]THV42627.1 hypothetical protein FAB82_05520 [Glycomyces buryatensis]
MTNYNCPRCGAQSPPERCDACGRGPVPLLAKLSELDATLAVMPPTLSSRAAVETERLRVLEELKKVAVAYRAEAEQAAKHAAASAPPAMPAPQSRPQPQFAPGQTLQAPAQTPNAAPPSQSAPPQTPSAGIAGPLGSAAPPPPTLPPPVQARPERGEVAAKTVQTTLLSLGGILVAAAIIIFTAVAWQSMGDAGRLVVLGGFTTLLLAVPAVLIRFRLWATAETFASLAALALWCSALAGYYLYLPGGSSLSSEAVGTWSALVLAALTAYRAGVRTAAPAWALLPLAAVGSAFAASGPVRFAAPLMLATAAVLAAASWVVSRRGSHYPRSDQWIARLLLCTAVIEAFLAGLRVAFGLSGAIIPIVAAAIAFMAAGNLLAILYVRRGGATFATLLIGTATTGALLVCAWVLAIRSGSVELAIPSLALLAAVIVALVNLEDKSDDDHSIVVAAAAGITALAGFAIVTFDAPDLTAYLVATLAIGLSSLLLPDPLRTAVRRAGYVGGVGVGIAATLISLTALPLIWWGDDAGALDWEIPIVLGVLAFGAALLPRRFRFDFLALALTSAVLAAGGMLNSGPEGHLLATLGLGLCAAIALAAALLSENLSGRCTGWVLLAAWIASTAGAALHLDLPEDTIELAVVVAAAFMLVLAAGAPRRSRPDRVLGVVLSHILAGSMLGLWLVIEGFETAWNGEPMTMMLPLGFGIYTLALAGVALIVPVKKGAYAIAALCTGTVGWWTLLSSQDIDTLEFFTVPPAAVLFLLGLWRLERRPQTGSWAALALPIGIGIGPSLLLALGDDDPVRRAGVAAAGVAVVIAGVHRRWQAPLVLGAIVLLAITANELSLVWTLIPKWIPLAIGGAVLIGAGATLEQRRKDVARIGQAVKSMR